MLYVVAQVVGIVASAAQPTEGDESSSTNKQIVENKLDTKIPECIF
jgi:hypothetical protein